MISGADVARLRAERGWSRRVLAERVGLTEGKVWRIENTGRITPAEVELLRALVAPEAPTSSAASTSPAPPVGPAAEEDPDHEDVEPLWFDVQQPAVGAGDVLHVVSVGEFAPSTELVTLTYSTPEPTSPVEFEPSPVELTRLDGVRRFSNSELQTFKTCRRKWWLAWYRGLRLAAESPVGIRAVGDRVHRALRAWYVPPGTPKTDPRDALERLIVEDWTNLVARGPVDEETTHAFQRDAQLERVMVAGYLEWLAETGADSGLTVVASETYVEADLPDEDGWLPRPVKLVGRLDVRVRRAGDDALLFVDHKTVDGFSARTRLLPLDEQMLHYHLIEYLNALPGEPRPDGALYNMLRRVKRTPAAKPPFYQRVEVRHNDHEVDSMHTRVLGEVADLLTLTRALDEGTDPRRVAYPRPAADCSWSCSFFPVCPMFDDGSRAEDMLRTYYVAGDPTDHYRTTRVATPVDANHHPGGVA